MDAFTEVEVDQSFERTTQTPEIKCDASTQVEQSLFKAKSTQTVSAIMRDKDVQTFCQRLIIKKPKHLPGCASIRKFKSQSFQVQPN
ncbi:hypothetical protein AVEN_44918-1 [Araneus ventricosus]|uniref:Uncharacterized protein n=1 Tax=Araneus ventricosus TaxID=182803 RepID=A0A4Y2TUN6_ARAVE|nr:hypothetical protein AVEN_44918-1 [Araneus ventricosus]